MSTAFGLRRLADRQLQTWFWSPRRHHNVSVRYTQQHSLRNSENQTKLELPLCRSWSRVGE